MSYGYALQSSLMLKYPTSRFTDFIFVGKWLILPAISKLDNSTPSIICAVWNTKEIIACFTDFLLNSTESYPIG